MEWGGGVIKSMAQNEGGILIAVSCNMQPNLL